MTYIHFCDRALDSLASHLPPNPFVTPTCLYSSVSRPVLVIISSDAESCKRSSGVATRIVNHVRHVHRSFAHIECRSHVFGLHSVVVCVCERGYRRGCGRACHRRGWCLRARRPTCPSCRGCSDQPDRLEPADSVSGMLGRSAPRRQMNLERFFYAPAGVPGSLRCNVHPSGLPVRSAADCGACMGL